MKAHDLYRAALGRHAKKVRSAVVLILVFVGGFVAARVLPDHAVTPRRISGTVTWSNADIHRLLFEADDDSADSGEYEVAAIGRLTSSGGAYYSLGLPICLTASRTEAFVRTDRRRVELEVISVNVSGVATRAAVIVRCLT